MRARRPAPLQVLPSHDSDAQRRLRRTTFRAAAAALKDRIQACNHGFEALQKAPYTAAPFRRPRLKRVLARGTDSNATRGRYCRHDVAFLLSGQVLGL